jgi:hypothetical protein
VWDARRLLFYLAVFALATGCTRPADRANLAEVARNPCTNDLADIMRLSKFRAIWQEPLKHLNEASRLLYQCTEFNVGSKVLLAMQRLPDEDYNELAKVIVTGHTDIHLKQRLLSLALDPGFEWSNRFATRYYLSPNYEFITWLKGHAKELKIEPLLRTIESGQLANRYKQWASKDISDVISVAEKRWNTSFGGMLTTESVKLAFNPDPHVDQAIDLILSPSMTDKEKTVVVLLFAGLSTMEQRRFLLAVVVARETDMINQETIMDAFYPPEGWIGTRPAQKYDMIINDLLKRAQRYLDVDKPPSD